MASKPSTRGGFFERLTRPHPRITNPEDKRRARTLTSIMLGLFMVLLALLIAASIMMDRMNVPLLFTVILVGIIYGMSRSPWVDVTAGLSSFGLLFLAMALMLVYRRMSVTSQLMVFLLLPVLISTLVSAARHTVGLVAVMVVFLSALVFGAPWIVIGDVIVLYAADALLSVFAAIMAVIRERDLQLLKEQSEEAQKHTARLETDVRRIGVTAEVGRTITATRDLERLLAQVVDLIIDRFDFYHAQVFLVDSAGQNAVLRQSTGEAGRALLARKHALPVGSHSVIGQVTSRGEPVIARDTDVDAVHRRNELLPDTRSELALPLRSGGRIIGALDIQSVNPDAFSETDVQVFQTMADQLSTAIENARLFEQAQRDLKDIERLNRQLTGTAWRDYVAQQRSQAAVGYQADDAGVRPLKPGENVENADSRVLSVPLTVRGEKIGMLDLSSKNDESSLDEGTESMLRAIAERVAMALDSTRLGERAQLQAAREQILSQLSAELQATTDMDLILRVAATEASRAVGADRGFLQLNVSIEESDEPEG